MLIQDSIGSRSLSSSPGARTVTGWRFLVILCTVLAGILATGGIAQAASPYQYGGGLSSGLAGTAAGQLSRPQRSAVDPTSQNLLVVDAGSHRVEVYSPGGDDGVSSSGEFGADLLQDPFGIAVDPTDGAVYVSDSGAGRIFRFTRSGGSYIVDNGYSGPASGSLPSEVGSFKASLTVDPTNGDLVVADPSDNLVKRFGPDGAWKSGFDGSTSPEGEFTGLLDVAANSHGDLYVVDATDGNGDGHADNIDIAYNAPPLGIATSRVVHFDASGAYVASLGPLTTPSAVAVQPDTDAVLVAANQDSYNSNALLSLHLFENDAEVDTFELPGPCGGASSSCWGVVTGVGVGPAPTYRLYAVTDSDLLQHFFGAVTIQTYEIPQKAETLSAGAVSSQFADLRGRVFGNGIPTTYHFEYGTTDSYGSRIPLSGDASAGDGSTRVGVDRWVNGLSPGTTYHYRLVATNSEGTAFGKDVTFTTPSAAAGGPAAERRGYELVSPMGKLGTDVQDGSWDAAISPDGSRVVFPSKGAFSGSTSSPVENYFAAERGATGWTTRAITPPWNPKDNVSVDPYFQLFSADLSHAALFTSDPPLVAVAQSDTANLYQASVFPQSGDYRLLTPSGPPGADLSTYNVAAAAASGDFSHVVFETTWPMTADAPADGRSSVYEWYNGSLRLASVLPGGLPAHGAFVGGRTILLGAAYSATAISRDGERVFFTDGDSGQLYVRIGGTTTERVSISSRTTPDPAGTRPVEFVSASEDGSRVLFDSEEKLTDDAQASSTQGIPELYEYDLTSGALTDLSTADQPTGVGRYKGLVGTSMDATTVYFVALSGGDANVYVWKDGRTKFVTSLASNVNEQTEGCNWTNNTLGCGSVRLSRVSSDGRYLLVSSVRPLDGYDTAGTRQLFLYDNQKGTIRCVSCTTRLARSSSSSWPVSTAGTGRYHGFDSRALLNGGRVFFETPQALSPEDSNGLNDVYMWADGQLSLISPGHGDYPSFFADASASGNDVLFSTRQPLVPEDNDLNVDFYDARVGGGFSSTAGTDDVPCAGDSCQGPLAPSPALAAPGRAEARAGGNLDQPPRSAISGVRKISPSDLSSLAKGGKARLRLKVNQPGTVTMAGTAKVGKRSRRVSSSSIEAKKAGMVSIPFALSKRAQSALRHQRSLTVVLTIRFEGARPEVVSFTLRSTAFKKGGAR